MASRDKNVKVLLVDDDEFLLDMYTVRFKEAGFKVDVAVNGQDAIDKIHKEQYDVILLDVVMPVIDGFDVLARIRKGNLAQDTVVIMLSNLGQKEDVDRGNKLGATDYIIKAHFTPTEVVEKIEYHLAKKKK